MSDTQFVSIRMLVANAMRRLVYTMLETFRLKFHSFRAPLAGRTSPSLMFRRKQAQDWCLSPHVLLCSFTLFYYSIL